MIEYEHRDYQEKAEQTVVSDLKDPDCNPVMALPTGSGKSKILSGVMYKYFEYLQPFGRVAVISHTENILLQNYEAIKSHFPGINIGLYSSGLESRTVEKITVAGIQSIYKKSHLFKDLTLAIIDECHTVPTKGNGMYQQFFKDCKAQRLGLTATHFRSGHGFLHIGEGAMFNKLSVDLCTMQAFNKLVEDKYLTELFSKPAQLQFDTDGVKESAGDYNVKDLSFHFDKEEITREACKELVKMGTNYSSWLVFAIDIDHADSICSILVRNGIKAVSLHSRADVDRHELTDAFKRKEIRAIVSVGMVTTGFDAPNIDLIVLLRPTKSPVLHIQMIGRGLRPSPGKTHCLVLDFAGNISRLGPINNVTVPSKHKKGVGGEPIVKTCPVCGCLHHPTVKICGVCGHEFEFKTDLRVDAANDEVVEKDNKPKWLDVTNIKYMIHKKIGKPESLRVQYSCGLFTLNEYICYDHGGYAEQKARNWVKWRWLHSLEMPANVQELYNNAKELAVPTKLLVETHQKYPSIKNVSFE